MQIFITKCWWVTQFFPYYSITTARDFSIRDTSPSVLLWHLQCDVILYLHQTSNWIPPPTAPGAINALTRSLWTGTSAGTNKEWWCSSLKTGSGMHKAVAVRKGFNLMPTSQTELVKQPLLNSNPSRESEDNHSLSFKHLNWFWGS